MIEKVVGYVDGQPVYYEETQPTEYETTVEVIEKANYEVEITATDDFDNKTTIRSLLYMVGSWIEPIWQRTQQDVNYAKYLNDKIAKTGWNSLTVDERTKWTSGLIGSLNAIDLNRIEQDTQYLSDLLNSYAYMQSISCKTDWAMSSLPYDVEIERLRSNIEILLDAFHEQEIALPIDLDSLNYVKLNAVENNLKLMKEMIHRMEDSFRYSGTFNSGQEVAL